MDTRNVRKEYMIDMPKVMLLVRMSRSPEREIVRGIARYSRLYGPWRFYRKALYYCSDSSDNGFLSKISASRVDGLIVGPTEFRPEMLDYDIPLILTAGVRNQPADIPYIVGNDKSIGEMAAEHFLDRGFKSFAYCGFDDLLWSNRRKESYIGRLTGEDAQVYIYKKPVDDASKTGWEYEQKCLSDWLKSLPKPVGILASNDDRALQVAEICQAEGFNIPEDVAIIGVDNDDLVCDVATPPLSSIALNWEEAGYKAAEMLAGMMKGEKVVGRSISAPATHVVTRRSSDILAIKDPDVALALKFIREHSREPIQVRDIVEAVAVSRRCLYDKFKKNLGRSIHQEIRKVRTDQVARMLIETNLSVSQIALELGYAGFDHIARHFRMEKGITPLAYRKKYAKK